MDLKIDPVVLGSITVLIVLILLGSATFQSLFANPKILIKEAPLSKNSEFRLKPGEQYQYSYILQNGSLNMTFRVFEGGNCTGIRLMEERNGTGICVDRNGMDSAGSNASFAEPSILFFKPWMLALNETWRWNTSMFVSYNGALNHIQDTFYRVIRKENYSGRDAFLVEIKSEDGPAEYDWIDAEKRIALRVMGEGYEVVLAED